MSTSIIDLKKSIKEKREKLMEEKGKLKIINKQLSEKIEKQNELKEENNKDLTIKKLIEESSSKARSNGKELLTQILTSSLQTVFGSDTEAYLDMPLKDGIPSLNISILKHVDVGTIKIDPTGADGGGLADIVSLSAFMGLGQFLDNNYAPYILDEPTKYVDKEETSNSSAEFFKNMVDFTGKQTIISTHDVALKDKKDKGYKLVMDKDTGISNAYED